jgi:hypothetical protein
LCDEFRFALRANFFGAPSVVNASAFLNADSADSAADNPVGGFWSAHAFERHGGKASYSRMQSSGLKMIARPILRPIPFSRAFRKIMASVTGKTSPTSSRASLKQGHIVADVCR